jgi:hypothetical protein
MFVQVFVQVKREAFLTTVLKLEYSVFLVSEDGSFAGF